MKKPSGLWPAVARFGWYEPGTTATVSPTRTVPPWMISQFTPHTSHRSSRSVGLLHCAWRYRHGTVRRWTKSRAEPTATSWPTMAFTASALMPRTTMLRRSALNWSGSIFALATCASTPSADTSVRLRPGS